MDGPTQAVVDIPAAPGLVLAVISDIAAYPRWAAWTTEAEVLDVDADGRPTRARFAAASGPLRGRWALTYDWQTTASGTGTVSWRLVTGDALRRLDGSHTLRAIAGGTRLVHAVAVDLKLPIAGPLRRRGERFLVDRVVSDLTQRVAEVADGDGAPDPRPDGADPPPGPREAPGSVGDGPGA